MEKEETRLEEAFEYVRGMFFPRWDREKEWTISLKPDLPSLGRCESSTKTIYFRETPGEHDLHTWIVHEICHSSTPGHGKKWSDRMLKAAERAKALGLDDLVEKIQKHVEETQRGESPSAPKIYLKIEEAVIVDLGDTALEKSEERFDAIMNWIAKDWGMYREDPESKYRRCRAVYDKAVREYKKYHSIRVKILKVKNK